MIGISWVFNHVTVQSRSVVIIEARRGFDRTLIGEGIFVLSASSNLFFCASVLTVVISRLEATGRLILKILLLLKISRPKFHKIPSTVIVLAVSVDGNVIAGVTGGGMMTTGGGVDAAGLGSGIT